MNMPHKLKKGNSREFPELNSSMSWCDIYFRSHA